MKANVNLLKKKCKAFRKTQPFLKVSGFWHSVVALAFTQTQPRAMGLLPMPTGGC